MPGLLEQFRQKVVSTFLPNDKEGVGNTSAPTDTINNLIALGVLLWIVAQADEKFLPEEDDKIREVLKSYGDITDDDMPIVLRAVHEAGVQRIDMHSFTRDLGHNLSFKAKLKILENLFRVACIDGDLAHTEHEMIRKIAGLLQVDHKEFINTKIKVKIEFGLDTAGL